MCINYKNLSLEMVIFKKITVSTISISFERLYLFCILKNILSLIISI